MKERGHNKKAANIRLLAGTFFALVMIMAFSVAESALCGQPDDIEAESVLQAARNYLDAEVRRDYPAVYACFSPSSSYAQINTYKQYLADARSSQETVVKYRIVGITYIKNNKNRLTYADVEKIAEVEVDVTFLNISTQHKSEVNIGFIFLKEGGKWYKS